VAAALGRLAEAVCSLEAADLKLRTMTGVGGTAAAGKGAGGGEDERVCVRAIGCTLFAASAAGAAAELERLRALLARRREEDLLRRGVPLAAAPAQAESFMQRWARRQREQEREQREWEREEEEVEHAGGGGGGRRGQQQRQRQEQGQEQQRQQQEQQRQQQRQQRQRQQRPPPAPPEAADPALRALRGAFELLGLSVQVRVSVHVRAT
jgi:hypothetical protein